MEYQISKPVQIGDVHVGGGGSLALIAGPCVIEDRELTLRIARGMARVAGEFSVPTVFKASFDKANRMSLTSFRGPGMAEGLEVLQAVHSHGQRWSGAVVGQVAGLAQGLRPEPSARPVRRAAIEGGAEDHDVSIRVGRRIVEVRLRHPEEGDVGAELRAVAGHGRHST